MSDPVPGAATFPGAATRALERLDEVEKRLGVLEERLVAILAVIERRRADRAGDERQAITDALAKVDGNVSRAAMALGVSRRTLQARMREHGLPVGRRGRPRRPVGPRGSGTL